MGISDGKTSQMFSHLDKIHERHRDLLMMQEHRIYAMPNTG